MGVHETAVVNLSIGSLHDGRITLRRLREVGKVLLAVWRRRAWADAIYFTISESRAGNLKDLIIYMLLAGRLRRLFVHLHGGTIGRVLFERHPTWRKINAAFIKRVGGVIISGPSHLSIFHGMIERARVHTVPNSAGDELFVDEQDILEKFADTRPLRMLYVSSVTPQKGYLDLVDAYIGLDLVVRGRIQLDMAGKFETDADRSAFQNGIDGVEGDRSPRPDRPGTQTTPLRSGARVLLADTYVRGAADFHSRGVHGRVRRAHNRSARNSGRVRRRHQWLSGAWRFFEVHCGGHGEVPARH